MCTNDSFALQVSHSVLGGLPCAVRLQANLVSQVTDTAAEQTKLAVDLNLAHITALSSILVSPFDSEYRIITAPAGHAKAGAGSLHALGQALALVATPTAVLNGKVSIAILSVPHMGLHRWKLEQCIVYRGAVKCISTATRFL